VIVANNFVLFGKTTLIETIGRVRVAESAGLRLAVCFCIGTLGLCLLTMGLSLSPLDHQTVRIILALTLVVSISLALSSGSIFSGCRRVHLFGYLLGLLSAIFCSLYLCFPNGLVGEALVDTSMMITGLPVDLIIPYNFSRMMLEGIDPNSIAIVPGWSASDRGPIAAILNSSIFYLTGLVEDSNWMGTSQGLFFLYQSMVISLNCLGLVVVWFFSLERYGPRAAAYSILALLSCHFVLLNLMFAWPKFFMAAIILTSLWLWLEEKKWFLSGVIAGLAMLTHDSAIFTVAAFGMFAFLSKLLKVFRYRTEKPATAIRDLAVYPLGFLLVNSPWLVAKASLFETSPRLIYMHLFCYLEEGIEEVSFSSLASDYFQEKGLAGALMIRLQNIFFPFDFSNLFEAIPEGGGSIYKLLSSIAPYQFVQAGVSFGPFLILVFLFSLYREWEEREKTLAILNSVAFLSLLFISLISGCLGNTVSHIWAYPAFLTFSIALGSLLRKGGGLLQIIFSIGVGINGAIAYIYLFYRATPKPFLHGSAGWYSGLLMLGLLIFVLLIWAAVSEDQRE